MLTVISEPLPARLIGATLLMRDMARLGIQMTKAKTILSEASRACDELRERLGGDGASVALALALGKLCAENGLEVAALLGMVEVSARETQLELDRGRSVAA
jgi:hypothetical protein